MPNSKPKRIAVDGAQDSYRDIREGERGEVEEGEDQESSYLSDASTDSYIDEGVLSEDSQPKEVIEVNDYLPIILWFQYF
ncbi:hypothetical protein HPULCUR_011824 [Helicostylum pulchrum]|uniref:Uncharacterized protein n=1 Tax=Helicostylum pulchrum TaxID=562976 RepID=A0ABP9YH61_9FUNG